MAEKSTKDKNPESINIIREILIKINKENAYSQFIGIEILELSEEKGLGRIKMNDNILNPYKTMHGGALMSFADVIAGSTACMKGHFVTTISSTLNFLLPATNTEYVYCECQVLKSGRTISVLDVKIKDDNGIILDSGQYNFFITDIDILNANIE